MNEILQHTFCIYIIYFAIYSKSSWTIRGWTGQIIIYVYGHDNTNIVQILVWSGTDILLDCMFYHNTDLFNIKKKTPSNRYKKVARLILPFTFISSMNNVTENVILS